MFHIFTFFCLLTKVVELIMVPLILISRVKGIATDVNGLFSCYFGKGFPVLWVSFSIVPLDFTHSSSHCGIAAFYPKITSHWICDDKSMIGQVFPLFIFFVLTIIFNHKSETLHAAGTLDSICFSAYLTHFPFFNNQYCLSMVLMIY